MKLEVFEDKTKAEEKPVRLRLIMQDGDADICAVDEDGNRLDILFGINGRTNKIRRYDSITTEGFPLDDEGRIELYDEDND